MYPDVWRSGTFLLYSCKVAFWIQETSSRLSDVERSVILQSMFAISSALTYLLFFSGMCHSSTSPGTSLHVTQFYQAFPGKRQMLGWEGLGMRLGYLYIWTNEVWPRSVTPGHFTVRQCYPIVQGPVHRLGRSLGFVLSCVLVAVQVLTPVQIVIYQW